jgi:hypothetical protein
MVKATKQVNLIPIHLLVISVTRILWSHRLRSRLCDKVSILEVLNKAKKGGVKCQEEMVLDQLDVDCVTDRVGKPVGEASKADKKDKEPGLGVVKADARNDICRPARIRIEHGF